SWLAKLLPTTAAAVVVLLFGNTSNASSSGETPLQAWMDARACPSRRSTRNFDASIECVDGNPLRARHIGDSTLFCVVPPAKRLFRLGLRRLMSRPTVPVVYVTRTS
ncbi:unnamed protein product, partial [Ectocarpus sp. 8 AP-2014]